MTRRVDRRTLLPAEAALLAGAQRAAMLPLRRWISDLLKASGFPLRIGCNRGAVPSLRCRDDRHEADYAPSSGATIEPHGGTVRITASAIERRVEA